MIKKRYLFFVLIICLFVISAVSAEEIANETDINVKNYDSILMVESVNEYVGSADNGTFTDLQKKIDNADEGSTIILEND